MRYKIVVNIDPDLWADTANTIDVLASAFYYLPEGYRFEIEEIAAEGEPNAIGKTVTHTAGPADGGALSIEEPTV